MRPKFILCAETVIVDQSTNNLSIVGVFEDITPLSLPIIVPRMTIVSVVEREDGDPAETPCHVRVSMGDQILFEQDNSYAFQNKPRLRNIMLFGGMPLSQPGILRFEILVGGAVFQSYEVLVNTPAGPVVPRPAP